MLSRVIGYVREAYIAYAFGAGAQTDAYVAAFTLPDWLNYIVAGGAASITFISIYTRFLAEKRDADAKKTFSVVITVMSTVMIVGTIVAEIFTPQFVRWMFQGFSPRGRSTSQDMEDVAECLRSNMPPTHRCRPMASGSGTAPSGNRSPVATQATQLSSRRSAPPRWIRR